LSIPDPIAQQAAQRLYYDDPALEFSARVTDIRLDSRDGTAHLWQVALDRTAFYPEGGGQPCDTGVLIATARSGAVLEVAVDRVEEDAACEVWHFVRKPLIEGTEIVGRIDAARRLDHTQQHSGQHLLSAVFLRELNAPTVGFHLGADNLTIDLAVETLSSQDLDRVELAANQLLYEDRPIRPQWVTRDDAEAMLARGDLRKLPDRSGPIRLVQIAGVEFNACGGTHVASLGQIGSILLRRIERIKKGQRVEFCCGLRAVHAARQDFTRLAELGRLLSTGPSDLPARVAALIEDKKATAKELKLLRRQIPTDTPETMR
jgi:alanyl-tRNA synthetase